MSVLLTENYSHTIALDQLLPVFFSLPPDQESRSQTFSFVHFTGGLGLVCYILTHILYPSRPHSPPHSLALVFSLTSSLIYSPTSSHLSPQPQITHLPVLSHNRINLLLPSSLQHGESA